MTLTFVTQNIAALNIIAAVGTGVPSFPPSKKAGNTEASVHHGRYLHCVWWDPLLSFGVQAFGDVTGRRSCDDYVQRALEGAVPSTSPRVLLNARITEGIL